MILGRPLFLWAAYEVSRVRRNQARAEVKNLEQEATEKTERKLIDSLFPPLPPVPRCAGSHPRFRMRAAFRRDKERVIARTPHVADWNSSDPLRRSTGDTLRPPLRSSRHQRQWISECPALSRQRPPHDGRRSHHHRPGISRLPPNQPADRRKTASSRRRPTRCPAK